MTFPMPFPRLAMVVMLLAACPRAAVVPADPAALWDAVRVAHTGGRRVETLRFHTLDELRPGVGEFFYPELAPDWVSFNVVHYTSPRMVQASEVNGDRITWEWDGAALTTTRNGKPYAPTLGIPRIQHLRVNRWLFLPSEAFLDQPVTVRRLPDGTGGVPRLAFDVDGVPPERVILELDPRTLRVDAVEYTARAVGIPGHLRAELLDTRPVGGAWVAHRIVETVPTGGAGVPFHDVTLWDVQVTFVGP